MPFAADDLELRVDIARLDRSHVVALTGELDLHTSGTLRESLAPRLSGGDGDVILDLSGIAFIDSTALGVLIEAARRLRERGAELIVATDDPRLRRLLEITGLLGTLRHERTLAEAVERVSARAVESPSIPPEDARQLDRRQEVER
jgi:anti-anti-sigma factor